MTGLIVAVVAIGVNVVDVAGVWSLRLLTTASESAARTTITLKQDGEALTGTCTIDQIDDELTVAGEVIGNALTWRCFNKEFEATFKGTIDSSGRQMTGEWSTVAAKGTFKGSKPPQ